MSPLLSTARQLVCMIYLTPPPPLLSSGGASSSSDTTLRLVWQLGYHLTRCRGIPLGKDNMVLFVCATRSGTFKGADEFRCVYVKGMPVEKDMWLGSLMGRNLSQKEAPQYPASHLDFTPRSEMESALKSEVRRECPPRSEMEIALKSELK
ncbi:hypothetical protein An12g03750 [Aspergillus niger]|uniref:Uncharacterized protein n=2 Tax=Aspergillus niger TaxID=5061 RepID=A2QZ61_ASPNC|nr:hypothetical protein An12g03750 [Aspergillus niger]CAK46146.1 hypothetical protein An12g03750 [Aspergillus niger]